MDAPIDLHYRPYRIDAMLQGTRVQTIHCTHARTRAREMQAYRVPKCDVTSGTSSEVQTNGVRARVGSRAGSRATLLHTNCACDVFTSVLYILVLVICLLIAFLIMKQNKINGFRWRAGHFRTYIINRLYFVYFS